MAKPGLSMNIDLEELAKVDGALRGMTKTVRTDRFLDDIITATHANLANRFNMDMDIAAASMPDKFHHVYEWGMLSEGRLWKHKLKGHGGNRLAAWDWKASKVPIPSPQERASNTKDPMSLVPDKKVKRFSDRKHVFIWKAPVMEYNIPVTIKPVYAKRLVFPVWDPKDPLRSASSVTIANPGGVSTNGAFTSYWASWWSTVAPNVMESTINQEIEQGIEQATMAAIAKGSRKATVGLSTMSYEAAMKQGDKWAEANLKKFAARYVFNNGEFLEDED